MYVTSLSTCEVAIPYVLNNCTIISISMSIKYYYTYIQSCIGARSFSMDSVYPIANSWRDSQCRAMRTTLSKLLQDTCVTCACVHIELGWELALLNVWHLTWANTFRASTEGLGVDISKRPILFWLVGTINPNTKTGPLPSMNQSSNGSWRPH